MDNKPQLSSISLPLRTRIQLGFLSIVTDFVRRDDGTINRRLMNFLDRKVPPNPIPLNGVKSHDFTVDAARDLWFRLFIPTNVPESVVSLPVIVFFHGGGFAFLSAGSFSYDAVCRRFARRLNAVVVSVNYRLTPEHKFPSQYDDGFDVLRKINDDRQNIKVWPEKADVSKCFLVGDSAGGNIAHNVTVRALQSNLTEVKIIGLITIQPFFGGKKRTESEIRLEGAPIVSIARTDWMWKAFLPDGLDIDHWAVNVSGPNAVDVSGLTKFPPTMVVVGGFDPLQDWQRSYHEWLRRCGKDVRLVEYPTAYHAFYIFPDVPESSIFINEVKEFLRNSIERAGVVE